MHGVVPADRQTGPTPRADKRLGALPSRRGRGWHSPAQGADELWAQGKVTEAWGWGPQHPRVGTRCSCGDGTWQPCCCTGQGCDGVRHACTSPEPQPDSGSVPGSAEPSWTQAHPVQADPDPGARSQPCNPGKGVCCSQHTAAMARSHRRPQGPSVLRGEAAQISGTAASPLPLPAEGLQEPAAPSR